MLSEEETDRLLKKYEATFAVVRSGNPVYRTLRLIDYQIRSLRTPLINAIWIVDSGYDTNHLASNAPIEDDSICTIMARDQSNSRSDLQSTPKGDMLFFGVFDGHSGWQTSKLLVNRLVPSVGRELNSIFRSEPEYVAAYLAKEITQQAHLKPATLEKIEIPNSLMEKVWSILTLSSKRARIVINNLDQDDDIVRLAIQNAFMRLDDEIVNRPVKMLEAFEAQARKNGNSSNQKNSLAGSQAHEVTPEQTASLQALLPALSGSCALLAYIDTARAKSVTHAPICCRRRF